MASEESAPKSQDELVERFKKMNLIKHPLVESGCAWEVPCGSLDLR